MPILPPASTIRFGSFEFDPVTLELSEGDRGVPLARQPALLLKRLVERHGELVTRQEVAELLWPEDTHVEVDLGINNAVRRLRRALDDSAQDPTYVETLTGLGYRFCFPVEPPEPELSAPSAPDRADEASGRPDRPRKGRHRGGIALAAAALVAMAGVAAMAWSLHRVERLDDSGTGGEGAETIEVRQRIYVDPWPASEETGSRRAMSPGHDNYLDAMYLLSRVPTEQVGETARVEEHVGRALDQLRHSLVEDPEYAPAWVALSRAHMWTGLWRAPADWGPEAAFAARRAVKLEPWNASAHAALSEIFLGFRYDVGQALKHAELAVSLGADEPWPHLARAKALAAAGDFEPALRSADRARGLDPANDIQTLTTTFLRFLAGRYDQALDLGEEILAVRPDEPGLLLQGVRVAVLRADEAGALAAADRLARSGQPEFSGYESLDDFWRDLLTYFDGTEYPISTASWFGAVAAFNLGRRQMAAQILLDSCRARDSSVIVFAPVDPQLRSLRGEPAFEEFLACLGSDAGEP